MSRRPAPEQSEHSERWGQPDVLGEPWLAETLPLAADAEGEVVATLVHRPPAHDAAVLQVHGFADYFFHADHAVWWAERGHDLYGLDLRKYGRSLREHQTPNYVADLAEHEEELDEAWRRITERDGHERVVISAHSTGGLVVALWADRRRREGRPLRGLAGMVLNSPWLDLPGHWWLRTIGTRALLELGRRLPDRIVPRHVSGFYVRSLHGDHDGEHDFDLTWKPVGSFPVRAGWLRAVRIGHAQLHRGVEVGCPVLVLSSARSAQPTAMTEEVHGADIVLDVEQIRRWAPALGAHVTSVAVEGARHDVLLSREPARGEVYDVLDRWRSAWI